MVMNKRNLEYIGWTAVISTLTALMTAFIRWIPGRVWEWGLGGAGVMIILLIFNKDKRFDPLIKFGYAFFISLFLSDIIQYLFLTGWLHAI